MKKDYHKGVKLQLYISDELNDLLNETLEILKEQHPNLTKSELIRDMINGRCLDIQMHKELIDRYGV